MRTKFLTLAFAMMIAMLPNRGEARVCIDHTWPGMIAVGQKSGWDIRFCYWKRATGDPRIDARLEFANVLLDRVDEMAKWLDVWLEQDGVHYPRPEEEMIRLYWDPINSDGGAALAETQKENGSWSVKLYAGLKGEFTESVARSFEFPTPENEFEFAHEVAHLIQIRGWGEIWIYDDRFDWVREGSADAFARYYLGVPWIDRYEVYDVPLHEPEKYQFAKDAHLQPGEKRARASYRRAEFFEKFPIDLGEEEGKNRILARVFDADTAVMEATPRGIGWISDIIRDEGKKEDGLFTYYPEYIAKHADNLEEHYSEPAAARPEHVFAPAKWPVAQEDYEGNVHPVAADPRKVHVSFQGGSWPDGQPPEHQVYLFVQELESDTAPDPDNPRSIVVDTEVPGKNNPHKRAVWAHSQAPVFELLTRVVNVNRKPEETEENPYKVLMSLQKVRWDPPVCVVGGDEFAMDVNGAPGNATIEDVAQQIEWGYAQWDVRGGTVVDGKRGVFRAPASGKMEIDFTILYDGKEYPVTVARFDVQPNDCTISFESAEMQGHTLVYTFKGDYSELASPDGARVYIGTNRVALYEPSEGGWVPIPPAGQAMFLAQFNGMMASANTTALPPWVDEPEPGLFSRMPRVFNDWWDYNDLAEGILEYENPPWGLHFACGPGTSDCRQIGINSDGVSSTLSYDGAGRLIGVEGMGFKAVMNWNTRTPGLPPGWSPISPTSDTEMERTFDRISDAILGGDSPPSAPPAPAASGSGGALGSGGSSCDCTCTGILKPNVQVCALQCAPQWQQCGG